MLFVKGKYCDLSYIYLSIYGCTHIYPDKYIIYDYNDSEINTFAKWIQYSCLPLMEFYTWYLYLVDLP